MSKKLGLIRRRWRGGAAGGGSLENFFPVSEPDNQALTGGWTAFTGTGTRTNARSYGRPAIRFQGTAQRPYLRVATVPNFNSNPLVAGTTYTISVRLAPGATATAPIIWIEGFTGRTGDEFASVSDADAEGWVEATFTLDTDVDGAFRIGLGTTANDTGDLTISHWQINTGSTRKAYLPNQADARAPTITAAIDQTTVTDGDVLGSDVTATPTISNAGFPVVLTGDLALTWRVDGAERAAGLAVSTGESVVARYSYLHESGQLTIDSSAKVVAAPSSGQLSDESGNNLLDESNNELLNESG